MGKGILKVRNAKELRVKESDRIKTVVEMIMKFGGTITEFEDGFELQGGFKASDNVSFNSYGDHRIAMSTIIGAIAMNIEASVDDTACINTSFPNFFKSLRVFN